MKLSRARYFTTAEQAASLDTAVESHAVRPRDVAVDLIQLFRYTQATLIGSGDVGETNADFLRSAAARLGKILGLQRPYDLVGTYDTFRKVEFGASPELVVFDDEVSSPDRHATAIAFQVGRSYVCAF